ncbi:MAG TPA: amino acid permease, partial [Streptomyces sp.]|nr:amino acid permease [Streptomyces sp.]
MSRDGMLPPVLHRVHPGTGTPVRNTLIVSSLAAVLAGLLPLSTLADLTSMGTLVAFTVVSIGVLILRRTKPDLARGSRVPGYPYIPLLSVVACLYLAVQLGARTYVLFVVWIALALV